MTQRRTVRLSRAGPSTGGFFASLGGVIPPTRDLVELWRAEPLRGVAPIATTCTRRDRFRSVPAAAGKFGAQHAEGSGCAHRAVGIVGLVQRGDVSLVLLHDAQLRSEMAGQATG